MQPPLKPQYFIYRPNGSMVPLIAMDELPPNVQIRGVSRTLPPCDTAGMMCIGEVAARHGYYVVDVPATQNNTNSILVDRSLSASMHAPATENNTNGSLVDRVLSASMHAPSSEPQINGNGRGIAATLYPGPRRAYGIQEQRPANAESGVIFSNPTNVHGRETRPLPEWHRSDLSVRRATGVKEYCSYWLRKGECDYAQQGCQYKHEMPFDLPTLNKCGLNDIPIWYRNMYRIASLHAPRGVKKDEKLRVMEHKNWRERHESLNASSRPTSRATSHTRQAGKTEHQHEVKGTVEEEEKVAGGRLNTDARLPASANTSSGESSSTPLSNNTAATTPETSDTDPHTVSSSDEYAAAGSPSTTRITPGGRKSKPRHTRGSGKKQNVESPFRSNVHTRRRLGSSSSNEADDDTVKAAEDLYGNGIVRDVEKGDRVKAETYDHDD
jgi:hypothetical protein